MLRCPRDLRRTAALCAALTALLVVPPAGEAQQPTPEQTLSGFVTTLNAGRPDCSLMVADLREQFVRPSVFGQPLGSPQTWTAENKLRLCSAEIAEFNGAWNNPEWLRTEILGTTVAERTDTVVRLRVRVRHAFRGTSEVRDQQINVWLQVEDGAWRLASHQQLLQTDDALAPGSLVQWPAYRGRLAAAAAAQRSVQEQQVASAQAATRLVSAQPVACAGRSSRFTDAARDVSSESTGARVPDQGLPTIDVRAASLHSRAGRLCWQVRFRRPPGPSFDLTINVWQRSSDPEAEEPIGQEVRVSVQDGKVLAGVASRFGDTMDFLPSEMSRTGNVLRLRVDGSDLRARYGHPDLRRSFHWLLKTSERSPTGTARWTDVLERGGAVAHRP